MSEPVPNDVDSLAAVRAAAAGPNPSGQAPGRHVICGTCHLIRCRAEGDQWCLCPKPEDQEADGKPLSRAWTQEVELCRCCAAEALVANSHWAHWFCADCLPRVRVLNQAFDRCVIPVGWHPLVNRVVFDPGRQPGPDAMTAFTDQVLAYLEEGSGMEAYAVALVKRTAGRLGFAEDADIDLDQYLTAAQLALTLGVLDKGEAFARLTQGAGAPPT